MDEAHRAGAGHQPPRGIPVIQAQGLTKRFRDVLAVLPTPRAVIVLSKFIVVAAWAAALTTAAFAIGVVVGTAVGLPGWSGAMIERGAREVAANGGLTIALMPPVALLARVGRGYLPPLGWALLTLALAQVVAAMGWGSWFPWSVPALFSGLAGPRSTQVDLHSYVVVTGTCVAGLAGTLAWWLYADQTR